MRQLTPFTIARLVCAFLVLGPLSVTGAMAMDLVKVQAEFTESYKAEAVGNLIGAIKLTKGTLERESGYYEATLRLGYLYSLSAAYTDAADYYRKASSTHPESIEARLGLMQALAMQVRWDEVIKEGAATLKLDQSNYAVTTRLAFAEYSKGNNARAEQHYKAMLALYPADLELKIGLGWTYLKAGSKKEAERLFEDVLTVSAGNPRALAGWTQARAAK